MGIGFESLAHLSARRVQSRAARRSLAGDRSFKAEFARFAKLASQAIPRFDMSWNNRLPMLHDRTAGTGFDRHYIYHTAWAARKVKAINPTCHVDIGSSLYFAGMISAFVPLRFYDFRPANVHLDGLATGAADLTSLPFPDGSIESLSCMHVVEHVGLGRYGDPLDPDGDRKAMNELARVTAPGGSLLFVVPIGRPVIRFNAHRIYSYRQVIESFSSLSLLEFSLIPDSGGIEGLILNASEAQADSQRYGCGCFWFKNDTFSA